MSHDALLHHDVDDVAVVIHDVAAGDQVRAVDLNGQEVAVVQAIEAIPLGHKIALRDMPAEHKVIKYGRTIGRATQSITKGAHVHTQNLKSIRWA
jgi:(2R)-sulfolactate sulfo-lyase subunit alpha